MRQSILSFGIAVLAAMLWASCSAQAKQQHVSSGKLEEYKPFASKYVASRNVAVWLPEGYERGMECDVVYMHDGQMLFDSTTTWNKQEWQVDEVMSRLISAGEIRPAIVVAIDNTGDRLQDYFPQGCREYMPAEARDQWGTEAELHADAYLRFIVEELKPFVDSTYRPLTDREHTVIMGSSMGGLISLYALCEYPQVFGKAGCISTHLSLALPMSPMQSVADRLRWPIAFNQYVDKHLPAANGALIYMDRGTVELDGSYAPFQEQMNRLIRSKGWDDNHFKSLVFDGHEHKETCWAARLDTPLRFFLGNK